jgi:hypothetical protein
LFVEETFATRICSFFAADLIIASVIFLSWSLRDARDKNIKGSVAGIWWWVCPWLICSTSLIAPRASRDDGPTSVAILAMAARR